MMKGLTFDNFINHPTNQNAFDICHQLARFEGERKRPIVLLGESGAGKSHLLWALVNHYRTSGARVGIALIAANDFPAKVKDLAVVPDKLTTDTPVVLLVDDLHRFERDVEALEKVVFAVHEHGHTVILATQIHPNVLPMLSGKLKALLSSGAIVGMKSLPRSEGSAIPEAALQEIASLRHRISELESGATVAAAAAAAADSGAGEPNALSQQLGQLQEERDHALTALEHSKQELRDLQERMATAAEAGAAPGADTDAWQSSIDGILERIERQKTLYENKLGALETEADQLLNLAASLQSEPSGDGESPTSGLETSSSDVSNDLADAQRIIAMQNEEMDRLRVTSKKLADALERQETEVSTVINGIRETVAHLAVSGALSETGEDGEGLPPSSKLALDAIAEQLQTLEGQIPENPEAGHSLLFDGNGSDAFTQGELPQPSAYELPEFTPEEEEPAS